MMLDNWGVTEADWRTALDRNAAMGCRPRRRDSPSRNRRDSSAGVSPRWPPTKRRARWNQQSVTSADLAREYGFTDIDGRQPDGWA